MGFVAHRIFERLPGTTPVRPLHAVVSLTIGTFLFFAPIGMHVNAAEVAENRGFLASVVCRVFFVGCADASGSPNNLAFAARAVVGSTADALSGGATTTVVYQTIEQPVIERVIERIVSTVPDAITEALLNARLAEIETVLSSRMLSLAAANSSQTYAVYTAASALSRIENLKTLFVDTLTSTAATVTNFAATNATTTNLYVSGTTTVSDIIVSNGPYIDVRAFGAKGDGVTDDTAAIQAAINSIGYLDKRTLLFPAGTYVVSGIRLSRYSGACANLRGAGVDVSTIKVTTATTSAIVSYSQAAPFSCSIEDLTINANGLAQYGLELQAGKQWKISRIKVLNSLSDAIRLGVASGAQIYETQMRDAYVEFETSTFAAGAQPDYGLHLLPTATDSTFDQIVVKNAKTASIRNESSNNIFFSAHVYGYPFEYAQLYSLYDSGGNNRYVGFMSDSASSSGMYLTGSNIVVSASQFFWLSAEDFPSANIVRLGSSASNIQIVGSTCKNMYSSASPITYDGSARPLTMFQIVGCSLSNLEERWDGTNSVFSITNGRKVGVGTTTPEDALSVNGDVSLGAVNSGYNWRMYRDTLTSDLLFQSRTGFGLYSPVLTLTSAGSVGVGTTSPMSKFSVVGNVYATAELRSGINGSTRGLATLYGDSGQPLLNIIGFNSLSGGVAQIYTASGANRQLQIVNTSSGEFGLYVQGSTGIGTTTPWRKLSVTGTVGFDGLTGSTGAGSLCLDVNKQVVYNSGADSCLSSTRDTKHGIAALTLSGTTTLAALEPVSFIYNNDASSTVRYGFIAEDAAAVDPHFATRDQAGAISGIDDRALIATTIKAVQELIADVHALAAVVQEFAERFTTRELAFTRATGDELTVQKLCVGATCITEAELRALLNAQSLSAQSPTPIVSTPTDEPADESEEQESESETISPADDVEAAEAENVETASDTPDAPSVVPADSPAEEEASALDAEAVVPTS